MEAKWRRTQKQRVEKVLEWPRRSHFGELVHWHTSEHNWLEGRGERIHLIQHDRRCDEPLVRALCASDPAVENMNHRERPPMDGRWHITPAKLRFFKRG